jgi:hypothetical protein
VDEILDITMFVAGVYERLGVPYLVGGSLASSLHGIPRATQDVDIVAEMKDSHVPAFVAALRRTFYLDEDAIRAAIAQRSSFNVVHLGSYFKADIFIPKDDEASRLEMDRRQRFNLGGDPPRDLIVASAEDVVAQKLFWFALGDRVSDRQWGDAVGVLKVAGDRLDFGYLRHVCALLNVESLLERARAEASKAG